MGTPGYSAEEKIKILYEQSLFDIREITNQCAALIARIEEANKPNTLLAGISKETNLLLSLDKNLVQSKDALLGTIEQVKAVHTAHIADLLAASANQMEVVSAEKLDAFTKCALATSQAEVTSIVQSAEAVKEKVLQAVGDECVRIVRERVAKEDSSLTAASKAYTKLTADFETAMVKRHKDALEAVQKFDAALQKSIEDHAQVGWFGRFVGIAGAVAFGVVIAGLLMAKGIIPMPSQSLSEQQIRHQSWGANLESKFNQFSKKEQDRINQVLRSK